MSPLFAERQDEDDALVSSINTTPLVDIMLVLLIIFLITIPVVTHTVPVALPHETNQPTQTRPQNITIAVDKEGMLFWNDATPGEWLSKNILFAEDGLFPVRSVGLKLLPAARSQTVRVETIKAALCNLAHEGANNAWKDGVLALLSHSRLAIQPALPRDITAVRSRPVFKIVDIVRFERTRGAEDAMGRHFDPVFQVVGHLFLGNRPGHDFDLVRTERVPDLEDVRSNQI
jgi:hypothetical protein